MESINFDNDYCSGIINFITNRDLQLICRMKINAVGQNIYWWAAAPPTYGISLSGSGMPYPNAIHAYENTINKGIITVNASNTFQINFKYPNAYYIGLGSVYISPHVNFKMNDNVQWSIQISQGIPFRMLTYPTGQHTTPRNSPLFYMSNYCGARSQEEILRASEYPKMHEMPANFWGTVPPH